MKDIEEARDSMSLKNIITQAIDSPVRGKYHVEGI